MISIALFCVNYNSYDKLSSFLGAIDHGATTVSGKAQIDIYIADNSDKNIQSIKTDMKNCHAKAFEYNSNLGYFGAIGRMMQDIDVKNIYDYTIISNVDLEIDNDFFIQLLATNVDKNTGWIAPQIYSIAEHRDRNPKIMERYAEKKLKVLRLFYKYPLLNALYTATMYKRKKLQSHKDGSVIYAGHGSLIILTKEFFNRCGIVNYPVFLFGEELYLAEECRSHHLNVVYSPKIRVVDSEHTSTSKMKKKFYNKCNIEAIDYILATYYFSK